MTTSTEQRVTCSQPGPRNDMGKPKLVATIVDDGVSIWCLHCRQTHLVSKEVCTSTWAKNAVYCVTCSQVSSGHRKGNDSGREKLVAKIVPGALLYWCRYCRVAHRLTEEKCIAVWEGHEQDTSPPSSHVSSASEHGSVVSRS